MVSREHRQQPHWTLNATLCVSLLNPFASRVVFNEVVQTSKYFMRDVTAVESSWLVELAPHFYKQAKVGPGYNDILQLVDTKLLQF